MTHDQPRRHGRARSNGWGARYGRYLADGLHASGGQLVGGTCPCCDEARATLATPAATNAYQRPGEAATHAAAEARHPVEGPEAVTHDHRTETRGSAGTTHCGRWTTAVPDDIDATRLVCTKPANHRRRHLSRWSGYEWYDGEEPRRTTTTAPSTPNPRT